MGDVPQMPGGFPNFGNIDLSELMRMLQAGGTVNMEIARRTAESVAQTNLESGEALSDPSATPDDSRAFDDVVRAVQLAVSDTTGISETLSLPANCVDRASYTRATLDGLTPVLEALGGALGRDAAAGLDAGDPAAMGTEAFFGAMMQQLVPILLGVWAGTMIGTLSHTALGQYDLPLPLDGNPELRFVASNVDAFAEEWSLPVDELRYALALRETVHGAQRSVPWVRARLVQLSSNYVSSYDMQNGALQDQLGDFDPMNPANAMTQFVDPGQVLEAMRSERQGPMLEELQRFVSVLEGYTDIVVETLGDRMVSAHTRIDEALRRHRLDRGEATAFVDRLLGLELDREHYEAGLAFCRGVLDRGEGTFEQLNRLWTSEAMVPTQSELTAPGLWLARIDLPE
jgi:putative hydrolase